MLVEAIRINLWTSWRYYAQLSLGFIGPPPPEPPPTAAATDFYSYHFGILQVIAAGNTRTTVATPCNNYNGICVSGTEDKNTLGIGDDAVWIEEGSSCPHPSGSGTVLCGSSFGPTTNGRQKPDLAAPAQNIVSLTQAGGQAEVDGTSVAAPHIMGLVAGMIERDSSLSSSVRRGILTSAAAGDTGPSGSDLEWNTNWGWGYPRGDRAVLNIGNGWYRTGTIGHLDVDDYNLPAVDNGDMLTVSLNWLRQVNSNGDYLPPNNLAVCIIDSTSRSWCSNANLDHNEVVAVCVDGSHTYKVRVVGVDVSGVEPYGLGFDKRDFEAHCVG